MKVKVVSNTTDWVSPMDEFLGGVWTVERVNQQIGCVTLLEDKGAWSFYFEDLELYDEVVIDPISDEELERLLFG